MFKLSSSFCMSYFRNRVVTCLLLTVFSFSFLPSVSLAQQPTATIKMLSGNVLVPGQMATGGTVLSVGDTIQTQAGASVVLELSDGSEIHLGEKTEITIAELTQTATGARVSSIKLLAGRVRAFLSQEHQQEGSAFTVETPNARLDATFSEPDIEVSYNQEKAETVGIAHTVELLVMNLVTEEETVIPVGSMAIITAVGIKVMAGAATAGAVSAGVTGAGTTSTATTGAVASEGMGTGTKTALGVGAAAAAGVAVALLIPDLLENCNSIDVQHTVDGEIVRAPEGTRCDMYMSSGGPWSQQEANTYLSEFVYEITLNNTPIQPKGSRQLRLDDQGVWHVYQWFQTDTLQKGVYNVKATYILPWSTSSKGFTIQAD